MVLGIILSAINRRRKKKFHKIGEDVKIPLVIRFSGYERISVGGALFLILEVGLLHNHLLVKNHAL